MGCVWAGFGLHGWDGRLSLRHVCNGVHGVLPVSIFLVGLSCNLCNCIARSGILDTCFARLRGLCGLGWRLVWLGLGYPSSSALQGWFVAVLSCLVS